MKKKQAMPINLADYEKKASANIQNCHQFADCDF